MTPTFNRENAMHKAMTTLILGLLLAAPGWADNKHERIDELIRLTQVEAQFKQMEAQMQAAFIRLVPDQDWSEGKRDIVRGYNDRMSALSREALGWPRMEAMLIELYDHYFTESEIADLIDFYRTSTGQRMTDVMPMIMEESVLFSQEAMARLVPEMHALSEALKAELAEYRRAATEKSSNKHRGE